MKKFWFCAILSLLACSDNKRANSPQESDDAGMPSTELDASLATSCTKASDCDDDVACTEDACEKGACVNEVADRDRDGYADGACVDSKGRSLGEDCDDNDPGRYPGNPEYCSLEEPAHDEDCDESTIGLLDADGDGETNALCSNPGGAKGTDCNDLDLAVRSLQLEFCDNKDNDCNGKVDDNPQLITWYRDGDNDLFGGAETLGESCLPLKGGSALTTDCDDTKGSLYPAQVEVCDGRDNNCNGIADDGSACGNVPGVGPAVAPGGEAEPATTVTIDVEGGKLKHPDRVVVRVAPGAVSEPLELSVRKAELRSLAGLPEGFGAVSSAYSLTPHGSHFAGRVELDIPYTAQGDGEIKLVRLNHEADVAWANVPTKLTSNTASAVTDRFSVYVVVQRGASSDGGVEADAGVDAGPEEQAPCRAIGLDLSGAGVSCVIDLDFAPEPTKLLVTLQGVQVYNAAIHGFSLDGKQLTLQGDACTTWEQGAGGLEAIATCEDVPLPKPLEEGELEDCPSIPHVTPFPLLPGICLLSAPAGDEIKSDLTLQPVRNHRYEFNGAVYVGEDVGGEATPDSSKARATLTIMPGTQLTAGATGALVINRGSKLEAIGSPNKPIVFAGPTTGGFSSPSATGSPGSWGGLVIMGRASHNRGPNPSSELGLGAYGGPDDADNSGTLEYVRFEYPGAPAATEASFSGVTFYAVGSGTTVDYVQVHGSSNDGIAFVGGTLNARHLVVSGPGRDGLSLRDGYRGKLQYALVQQVASYGDHGLVLINQTLDEAALPISVPTISNFSLLGNTSAHGLAPVGVSLGAGTQGHLYGVLVTSFKAGCVDVEGSLSTGFVGTGELSLLSSRISCSTPYLGAGESLFTASASGNLGLESADVLSGFLPRQDSGLLTGGQVPEDDFFDPAAFIGAFGADDWTAGWTSFPSFTVPTFTPE